MLFLPSSLSPNSISIDASKNNTFTWQVNGDAQTSFKIQIYRNDTSALVYNSTQITSSSPQYTLPLNTLSNSVDYKYTLTVYAGTNSVVSDYVFIKCNLTPVITLTIPSSISTQSYTATASYSQADNIPFNSYKFILYDSIGNIITDYGWIYAFTITQVFSGFVSGNSYQIECITRSNYSIQATSGKQSFTVSYTSPDSINLITTTPLDDTGGIKIDWSPIIQLAGTVTGTSSYVTGKFGLGLNLPSLSSINYPETVPLTFTLMFYVKLPVGFTGDIISLGSNEFFFGYNGTRFYINCSGIYLYGNLVALPTTFFKVGIKHDEAIIQMDSGIEYVM